MKGYDITRQPGYDVHGLPIEVKVEESFNIKTKKEIEESLGVENFISACRKFAYSNIEKMTSEFKRLGIWMDWDNPYITEKREFILSAWWTLKKAEERKLLEKDYRVIYWCPRCETALAEHEVRGEYRDVKDPSIFIKFPVRGKENTYLLVWTTTPWTLPSNVAIAVNPEYDYVEIELEDGEHLILSKAIAAPLMGAEGIKYKLIDEKKGYELEGMRYVPIFENDLTNNIKNCENAYRIYLANFVTLEEGTGLVHIAPGHGEEDFELGKEFDLPVVSPVDSQGRFLDEVGKYAGLYVKSADKQIIEDLEKKGLLFKKDTIVHSYPHCWRCKTPLIFIATEQWFLKISKIKREILEKNREVEWVPEWVAKRYVNGVENVGDWCISRQRYWGIPLPIWVCDRCKKTVVIGTLEELERLSGRDIGEKFDLHRPWIDSIKLKCECGGVMSRVPDVLDVWFDSGIASWASLGYPMKKEKFERLWPADFILEGEDQVNKWFYSQQATSIITFDRVPYRRVLMHGFALDKDGRKMSKSLGNVVAPEEVVSKYGADILRFYLLSATAPWEDLRFSWEGVETVKRIFGIFYNVYTFVTTYMELDRYVYTQSLPKLPEDVWLISKINSLIKDVERYIEKCQLNGATRAISNFIVEDLSRWYVKLVRRRTWIEKDTPEKMSAYFTLWYTFDRLLRVISIFAPHIAEEMYQNIIRGGKENSPLSVFLCKFPTADEDVIDTRLERDMEIAKEFAEKVAYARQSAGIKLRWPVKAICVDVNNDEVRNALEEFREVLMSQTNTKQLLIGQNIVKPERYVEGEITGGRFYIDIERTDELVAEALARELIRRVQEMRKRAELEVEQEIEVIVGVPDKRKIEILNKKKEYIGNEVRAKKIEIKDKDEVDGKQWNIDGESYKIEMRI